MPAPHHRPARPGARHVPAVLPGVLPVVLVAGLLAACGSEDPDDSQAGFGLPVRSTVGDVDVSPGDVVGVLRVETNGCFTWDDGGATRPWVVWPDGAEHDGDQVLLPDGTPVGDGQRLVGTGAVVDADAFADWANPDSYLSAFGGFCEAGERGVVVLEQVSPG